MMTFGALLGSVELGMIYAVLALGVFLSFRTLNMPDLTVDGSIVTGMAVSAVICAGGGNAFAALAAAHEIKNSGNPRRNSDYDGVLLRQSQDHGKNTEHSAYKKRDDL